jgi:hypothetical protein
MPVVVTVVVLPFLDLPVLATPHADTDPSALACSVSGPGTIPPRRLGHARLGRRDR